MLYASLRSLARMAPPVHSARRVLLTPILSLPRRVGLVRNAIRVCYTLRFALLRFAYASITHVIALHHSYRNQNDTAATNTHHATSYTTAAVCIRTRISHTEKVNPFSTNRNRTGGWAFSKSFPLRHRGFKTYMEPVASVFVILYFSVLLLYL